ncbi:hypothetical protein [Mycolicibacterium thermoresistibile]
MIQPNGRAMTAAISVTTAAFQIARSQFSMMGSM